MIAEVVVVAGDGGGLGRAISIRGMDYEDYYISGTHHFGKRQFDVTSVESVQKMFDLADNVGKVVGLINCAGTIKGDFWNIFDNNVRGAKLCLLEAVKRPSLEWVINIGSSVGETGNFTANDDYAASKAALHNYTKTWARAYAPIRVNCIAPGIIDTPIHKDREKHGDGHCLLRRLGTAEEVAQVVWSIAHSTYVTGQIIEVNGGR